MGSQLQGRTKTAHGRRRAHRAMSDINVTPLVDVMLVLLVVFMITAPLLTAGVKVDLPDAKAKALQKHDSTPVEVTIDSKGDVYFGKNKVTEQELRENLEHVAQESPEQLVYLRADQKLSYGHALSTMAIIQQSGLPVALIAKSQQ
ncbi:MAG: protein TolR [Alphaproteobacteria bacterium]|nr:MAG: protein TolR [Alphaproteobacteria bacterium]